MGCFVKPYFSGEKMRYSRNTLVNKGYLPTNVLCRIVCVLQLFYFQMVMVFEN